MYDGTNGRPPPHQVIYVEQRVQGRPDRLDSVVEIAVLEPVPSAMDGVRQHLARVGACTGPICLDADPLEAPSTTSSVTAQIEPP